MTPRSWCAIWGRTPGNNGVTTAISDGPKPFAFVPTAHIHSHQRKEAVLVACHSALRAAMELTPLAAAAMGYDALQQAEVEHQALELQKTLPACL